MGEPGAVTADTLKGNWKEVASWAENVENVQLFLFADFVWLFHEKKYISLWIWAPNGTAMKSRKGLACDIVDTFATHSSLVHDVTDQYRLHVGHKMAALTVVFQPLSSDDF